jgi:hypothetical protein
VVAVSAPPAGDGTPGAEAAVPVLMITTTSAAIPSVPSPSHGGGPFTDDVTSATPVTGTPNFTG